MTSLELVESIADADGDVDIKVVGDPTIAERLKRITTTLCSSYGAPAYALSGGSLWCLKCLKPYMTAGEAYSPSISVSRVRA